MPPSDQRGVDLKADADVGTRVWRNAYMRADDCITHIMSFLGTRDIHSFRVATFWEPVSDHCAAALLKMVIPGLCQIPSSQWLMHIPLKAMTTKTVHMAQRAGAQLDVQGGSVLLRACGRLRALTGQVTTDFTPRDEERRVQATMALLSAGADPRWSGAFYSSHPTPLSCFVEACGGGRTASEGYSARVLDTLRALVNAGSPVTHHCLRTVKRDNAPNCRDALTALNAAPKWFSASYHPGF